MSQRIAVFSLAFAAIISATTYGWAQSPLTRHVRGVTSNGQAKLVGKLPEAQPLQLDIVLPLRDRAGLQSFLKELYTPGSSIYKQYLTPAEFTARFGPTQQDYDDAVQHMKNNGFEVVGGSRDGMDIQVKGPVSAIENAFHLNLRTYQHPTEKRIFYSPDREPTVGLPFSIWHISGLDNFSVPKPRLVKRSDYAKTPGVAAEEAVSYATTGSGPSSSFTGSDMRAAYYGSGSLTGAGQTLGLLEYYGTDLADLTTYYNNIGETLPLTPMLYSVDGTSTSCKASQGCDDGEQNLDMTQALGMAPGLANLVVFIGSTDTAILAAMTTYNPLPATIGCSWAWTPADPSELAPYFEKMAAQGQNFFAASGDTSTWSSSAYVYPADDANVVSVGGTSLTTASAGGVWAAETAWTYSGGGVSPDGITIPSYQQLSGVINSSNGGSATLRNGPDVAANADFNFYTCSNTAGCLANTYGGTSFAAPMWAAYVALLNQQLASSGQPTIGFLNLSLYSIGTGSDYATNFHDVASGASGSYSAVAGYDLVTGWGSPNGASLIGTLESSATAAGFSLSALNASVSPGGTGAATITETVTGGYSTEVTFSASGLPTGVTASFNPTSLSGTGSSTLTFTAASTAIPGTYTITVTGTPSSGDAETTLLALAVSDTATVWVQQSPSQSPASRAAYALAYDATNKKTVMFGGYNSSQYYLNSTWTWDGSSWTQASPSTSPSARDYCNLAYDATHGNVVLFGGWSGSAELSDTWTWNGSNWTQQSPTSSPSGRDSYAMAYDALHGEVVVFGGYGSTGYLSDTWIWNGSSWTQMAPANVPAARYGHTMAYDELHGQIVLFGGYGSAGLFSDTWTWDGSNWTLRTPAGSPSARLYTSMAYDALHGQIDLFGGVDDYEYLSDSWQWNGSNWTQYLPAQLPSLRGYHAMAYDAINEKALLFGGYNGSFLNDTWLLSNPNQVSFVPIVLSNSGANGSYFTSELTFTNRGTGNAAINLSYTDAVGNGASGTATDTLPAGTQTIIPDAITYLRSLGIPIPSSDPQRGTLGVSFTGLSAARDGGVTVRTTTDVSDSEGRAGLAYPGNLPPAALAGPAYICGLRQDSADRSNLAIQNMGSAADGDVTLRLTVYSGDTSNATSTVLSDYVLEPGGWNQIGSILTSNGLSLSNGYVRVERVSGTAPYYAYGAINDNANSDGSFIPPLQESSLVGKTGLILPAVVEVGSSYYQSELIFTNWGTSAKTLNCRYVADAITTADYAATFTLTVNAGEQKIISNFVDYLRTQGVAGIGAVGPTFAGALFITASGSDDLSSIAVAARTSAPGGGGEYGVFYTAVPAGETSTTSAWLYGLQQDADNRSNLALVNTGETDDNSDTFQIDLYDGSTGTKVATVTDIVLAAQHWTQIGTILAQYASTTTNGYAHVIRTAGNNPFITYGVVNDGGTPGTRTGDGAFITSTP